MAKAGRRVHFLRATLAIARNAIGEATHRMILQVILFFGILLVVGGSFFTYMAPQEEHKMLTDLGLSIIAAFGMMLAIYMGAMAVQPEIERRTIYALLAKPVRRWEFVLGKFLGSLAVLLVSIVVMGLVLVVMLYVREGNLYPDMMLAVGTTFIGLGMMMAVVMMISTILSPLLTVITAVVLWIVGYMQTYLVQLAEHAQANLIKMIIEVLRVLLPNVEKFDLRVQVVNQMRVGPDMLNSMVWYGVAYTAVVLILAIIFFNEKQV
jgi:ABC-type transport system involved in multi-copper enzyme maturation permease subunit